MSIIDNFFIKSRVFSFISNILKLQQLQYNNFCQNFNWFFEKIKKSFYLGKSRKRKTARKSRKIFHLSDCCEQPHPPTPSPNREGESIPLCQERVPEACSAILRAGEVVQNKLIFHPDNLFNPGVTLLNPGVYPIIKINFLHLILFFLYFSL